MSRPILPFSLLVLIGIWHSGCSSDGHAGINTGSETTNAVTLSLARPDGSVAGRAWVRIRPLADSLKNTVGPWIQADLEGKVAFRGVASGDWVIEAKESAIGMRVAFLVRSGANVDLGQVNLGTRPYLAVKLPSGVASGRVRLDGSSVSVASDSGVARIGQVLPGIQRLLLQASDGSCRDAIVQLDSTSGVLDVNWRHLSADSVLIDDFDQGQWSPRYSLFSGYGWWWVSEGPTSIHTDARPIAGAGFPIELLQGNSARSGKSARFAVDPKSSWLWFGLDIDPQPISYRDVDSIVFWAKGKGNLEVKLGGPWDADHWGWSTSVALDSTWRRLGVSVSSMKPNDMSNAGRTLSWLEIRDQITSFSFGATAGPVDASLDDIMLKGRNLSKAVNGYSPSCTMP